MRKSSVIFNSSLPRHSMTEQKFGVKVTQTLDTAVTILGTTYSEFYTRTNLRNRYMYFPGQWQRACPSPKHFPPRATRGHRAPWQGLGLCLCVWEASVPLSTPAICFGGVGAWGRTSTPENSIPCCSREESSSRLLGRNGTTPLLGCSGNTESGGYPAGHWHITPLTTISTSLFSCRLCPCPQWTRHFTEK